MNHGRVRIVRPPGAPQRAGLTVGRVMDVYERNGLTRGRAWVWVLGDHGRPVLLWRKEFEWVEKGDSHGA